MPERAEIWWVNLDPTVGAEIRKTRPAIVVSSDALGRLPLKLIAPITAWNDAFARNLWHVRVTPDADSGLSKVSVVDTLQLRGADLQRFVSRIGRASPQVMDEVTTITTNTIEFSPTGSDPHRKQARGCQSGPQPTPPYRPWKGTPTPWRTEIPQGAPRTGETEPMINAQKAYLQSFFHGGIRYVVPFYQRAYVWGEENWETLWENIWQIFQEPEGPGSEHFIGTLIFKQRQAQKIEDNSYDLIDGQQRLTTIAILLKTVADSATGELPNLRNYTNGLLVFSDARGNRHYRIEHNRLDRPYFQALMDNEDAPDPESAKHRMELAYRYFCQRVQTLNDEQRELLVQVVLARVPVISMLLSADDDEQVIFDTINSLGVKLTTAELLKNYVFREQETRSLYDSHWQSVFEADDSQVAYWERHKTAGRLLRTNIEVLLYCYLMMITKREIRLDKLFKEYKDWLKDKGVEDRVRFLCELKELAEVYFSLPDGEDLAELRFRDHEKRFFYVIDSLSITTAYPLVLFLYLNYDGEARLEQLRVLEAYLVRRTICRLTTKNYNNLFLSVLQKLDDKRRAGCLGADSLRDILTDYTEETSIFPTDDDVIRAFSVEHLSNQNARTILFCIALYQQDTDLHDAPRLSPSSFSTEHMMPREWRTYWSDPDMTDAAVSDRDRCLVTFGNLTLITKRLNSKLRNAPWLAKRATLRQYSSLRLTTQYLDLPQWTETGIAQRGQHLSAAALQIWKR